MLCKFRYANHQKSIGKCMEILRSRLEIHGNPSISHGNTYEIKGTSIDFAGNPTKTAHEGLQSSKSIEILKKWSWSPPDPKIHRNRTLIRDLCQKYENMSATEGNKHVYSALTNPMLCYAMLCYGMLCYAM